MWLWLATAFGLGALHSFESDHLAAVAGFVASSPAPARAAGLGLRWGLGHSGAILALGGAAAALRIAVPEALFAWGEWCVGLLLIGVGLWTLHRSRAAGGPGASEVHAHGHWHGGLYHVHAHGRGDVDHRHRHAILWVGAAHGVGGTSGAVALLPAALAGSPLLAAAYLASFGFGTTLGMGLFAYVAGLFGSRASRWPAAYRYARVVAGLGVLAWGAVWLVERWPS